MQQTEFENKILSIPRPSRSEHDAFQAASREVSSFIHQNSNGGSNIEGRFAKPGLGGGGGEGEAIGREGEGSPACGELPGVVEVDGGGGGGGGDALTRLLSPRFLRLGAHNAHPVAGIGKKIDMGAVHTLSSYVGSNEGAKMVTETALLEKVMFHQF